MVAAMIFSAVLVGFAATANADSFCWKTHHTSHSKTRGMSLRLGANQLSLSEDKLDLDRIANLGGPSLALRWTWNGRSALEAEVSGLLRESQRQVLRESRGLASISYVRYFGQGRRGRWYGSVGWIGVVTQREFGDQQFQFAESGGTAGIGREWNLGKRWLLSADVRAVWLRLRASDPGAQGDTYTADDGQSYPARWVSTPQQRIGANARVALGYRF